MNEQTNKQTKHKQTGPSWKFAIKGVTEYFLCINALEYHWHCFQMNLPYYDSGTTNSTTL